MSAVMAPTRPASSWELVIAAQSGDKNAFSQIYRTYSPGIYLFLVRRTSDHHLAEDLTSATFLRVLTGIGSVTDQGRDIGAWMTTIARNLFLDHVKSSRYRQEVTVAEMRDSNSEDLGPEALVIARVEADELSSQLTEAIGQLLENQREVITMRFLDGLSPAETATMMDLNEGAVKARQVRGLRNLAKLIPQQIGTVNFHPPKDSR